MDKNAKHFKELWDLSRKKQGMRSFESLRKELLEVGYETVIIIEPFKLPLISIHVSEEKHGSDEGFVSRLRSFFK